METFSFPYHTQETEYPESGTRVQLGGGYIFTAPPSGPDLRRFRLKFPTMFYYPNDEVAATNLLINSAFNYTTGPHPTSWTDQGTTTTAGPQSSSQFAKQAWEYNASASRTYASQLVNLAANSTYRFSVLVEEASSGIAAINVLTVVLLPAGATYNIDITSPAYSPSGTVREGILSATITTSATAGSASFRVGLGTSGTATGKVRLSQPQLELTNVTSRILTTTAAKTRLATGLNPDKNYQINMTALEAFYSYHKLYRSFIYPHPVYGNVECKFFSPLKIPEGVGNMGALKDFTLELIEVIQ